MPSSADDFMDQHAFDIGRQDAEDARRENSAPTPTLYAALVIIDDPDEDAFGVNQMGVFSTFEKARDECYKYSQSLDVQGVLPETPMFVGLYHPEDSILKDWEWVIEGGSVIFMIQASRLDLDGVPE